MGTDKEKQELYQLIVEALENCDFYKQSTGCGFKSFLSGNITIYLQEEQKIEARHLEGIFKAFFNMGRNYKAREFRQLLGIGEKYEGT